MIRRSKLTSVLTVFVVFLVLYAGAFGPIHVSAQLTDLWQARESRQPGGNVLRKTLVSVKPGRKARGTNQDIRKFNLKDFAYREAVKTLRKDWAEAVKFIEQEGEAGGKDDWVQAKNIQGFEAKPIYGDLTSDGSEEAAVWVSYELGGTSSFTGVFVYTLKNGTPNLLARIKGGDRAHGAIESVKILNGRLIVGRYKPTKDDCNACYGYIETTKHKWRGNKFLKESVEVRKFKDE